MINSVVMQNIDLEKQPVVWREYCWKYFWKEAQHVLLYYTAELMFKLFVNCQQTVQNLSYMIILTFCHSAKNKLDSPVIRVSTVDYLRLAFLVKTISGSKRIHSSACIQEYKKGKDEWFLLTCSSGKTSD